MVIKKLNESINQIDNTDTLLDNMRTEVQKIIDNHLKDGIEPIFVKNRGFEKLNLFINLLTGHTTREELETRRKQNIRELQMLYEQVICENNLNNSQKNLKKDIGNDLSSLESDMLLKSSLNNLGVV